MPDRRRDPPASLSIRVSFHGDDGRFGRGDGGGETAPSQRRTADSRIGNCREPGFGPAGKFRHDDETAARRARRGKRRKRGPVSAGWLYGRDKHSRSAARLLQRHGGRLRREQNFGAARRAILHESAGDFDQTVSVGLALAPGARSDSRLGATA